MEAHPGDGLQPRDPGALRISDEDRHAVAEVLRRAAGEGRLDLDELDERLESAYSAKTYADLVPLTVDLPAQPGAVPAVGARRSPDLPATSHTGSFALMSESSRRGVWSVPAHHTAVAVMGSVLLDLREARFQGHEVVITASAVMGDVKVIVNPSTAVVVDGIGIMGEFKEQRGKAAADLTAGSPVVRLKGLALMGTVSVQRRPMPA